MHFPLRSLVRCWNAGASDGAPEQIYFAKSSDHGVTWHAVSPDLAAPKNEIDLDAAYPKIAPDSWLVLVNPELGPGLASLPGYVELYRALGEDFRKALDDKDIDAVVIAVPNHWHALASVWAMQAGKHVYVEKPASHTVWEGRRMVEAATRYNRIVQVGTMNRSRPAVVNAIKFMKEGGIGKVYMARGLCFKWRDTIGRKPVEVANRQRFFDVALPAALLAQPRADPAKRRRQGEIVRDDLRRGRVVVGGDPERVDSTRGRNQVRPHDGAIPIGPIRIALEERPRLLPGWVEREAGVLLVGLGALALEEATI